MTIQPDKKIKVTDLEEEFSIFFPYLKIALEPIANKEDLLISGTIEINPAMRMDTVRELFVNEMKLFPTFFRKKGEEWINISKDSLLSLNEENETGRRETGEFVPTRYEDFLETDF